MFREESASDQDSHNKEKYGEVHGSGKRIERKGFPRITGKSEAVTETREWPTESHTKSGKLPRNVSAKRLFSTRNSPTSASLTCPRSLRPLTASNCLMTATGIVLAVEMTEHTSPCFTDRKSTR